MTDEGDIGSEATLHRLADFKKAANVEKNLNGAQGKGGVHKIINFYLIRILLLFRVGEFNPLPSFYSGKVDPWLPGLEA